MKEGFRPGRCGGGASAEPPHKGQPEPLCRAPLCLVLETAVEHALPEWASAVVLNSASGAAHEVAAAYHHWTAREFPMRLHHDGAGAADH